ADLGRLGQWKELSIVEIEAGDVHEDAAGRRLARAASGENIEVKPLNAGSWPLAARKRGLVEVDAARLAELNDSDDLAVVTLPHGQIVNEDEIAGRAKIVPFVTREEEIARAERIGAVLNVRPFQRMRVAALVQENLDDASLEKFRAAFDEKVRFFGSELSTVKRVTGDLAAALRETVSSGAQVVAMAGSKLMDPLDPVMRGLTQAGARVEKHGVPLHPGTLLWVATVDGAKVIGAPGCALFSKATAFDVLLARVLAGEKLSRKTLAQLGAGGLLTREMAFRFPPYRPGAPRGEL
ncbi:MAG: hypothetical protein ABR567_13830, partial [Myxococcales bacterium]